MRLIGAGLSVHIQYMDIYVQCHVCVYMYYNKRLLYLHEDRMFQSEVFISSTICMYCILLNKELQKELETNSATSLYYIICLHGSRLARVCVTCIRVHVQCMSPIPLDYQTWKGSWSGHTVAVRRLRIKGDVYRTGMLESFPHEYMKLRYDVYTCSLYMYMHKVSTCIYMYMYMYVSEHGV